MKRQPREIEHLSYVPDDQLIMPTTSWLLLGKPISFSPTYLL